MCQNDPDIYPTIENMQLKGGNFVKHLAATYCAADPNRKKILLEAFQNDFQNYRPAKQR